MKRVGSDGRVHPATPKDGLVYSPGLPNQSLNVESFYHSTEHDQLKDKMLLAIKAMKGRKYEVWHLLLQNKTLGEIAIILGMSKGSVQTYYKRGIKEIRKLCS